jgi:hypothetical protein
VNENGTVAIAAAEAETASWEAGPALTVIELEVPAMVASAVMVWPPAVFNVAE